ncbi:hypothetical protein ACLOJK_031293 [Asimina triloba]
MCISTTRVVIGAIESSDGAIGDEDAWRRELSLASHQRHGCAGIDPAAVVACVRLPQHAIHVARQRVELEAKVQVSKAIVMGDSISTDPETLEGGEESRAPPGAFASLEEDGFAVERASKTVEGVVPCCYLLGAQEETVAVEEDAEGLDLSEVSADGGVPLANEVGIDVEAGVGEETEITVSLAVEVDDDAVAADEPWILANCSGPVAVGNGLACIAVDDTRVPTFFDAHMLNPKAMGTPPDFNELPLVGRYLPGLHQLPNEDATCTNGHDVSSH